MNICCKPGARGVCVDQELAPHAMMMKSHKPGRWGIRRLLPLLVSAMLLAIIAQTWWTSLQDRQLTLDAEQTNGLVAVRLLEELASQTLQDAVRKLDMVAAMVPRGPDAPAWNEADFRQLIARQSLQETRHLKALQFINPQGLSWITSPDYPSHQEAVGERPHVRYLLDHPQQKDVVIGHPFASRYDSQLVIPVARNLYAGDERHVGVISADIRVPYFGELYARVAKANNASVTLLANEGFVIVRSPFEARYADRDISDAAALRRIITGAQEGSFEDESFLDDEQTRLYTYRKVEGFPLTTVYGRDLDSILLDWRQRTRERIFFTLATVISIGVLTALLLVYLRRLKRSTATLRENESKFVGLFQRSPMPLVLVNRATRKILDVNDAWLQLFGFSAQEVLSHSAAELDLWVKPQEQQALNKALESDGYVDRSEVLLRHKDGQTICCVVTGRVIESAGESCALFSSLDVTQQHRMALELQELNQQLEQRVQARTESLAKTNQELLDAMASLKTMQAELIRSEKLAALGSLVAGVAHELNTPIGTSFTVASTLQDHTRKIQQEVLSGGVRRKSFDDYLAAANQGLDILMRTLRRAVDLIGSFKGVAVDQASNLRRRFELQEMLQDLLHTLQPMCRKTPYVLSADLPEGIKMDSYPGAIGQVVTNCVTNALMHAFEGRAQGHMLLNARAIKPDQVEISFTDDGIGMDETVLRRVFDPFFTTKFGQGGSGLGMHIVNSLVTDVLGGTISLHSAPGEGLKVLIVIPLTAPKAQADSTSTLQV